MKLFARLLLLAAVAFTASPALAQMTPLPSAYICNACAGSLSVTATSARVALPSTSPPYSTLTVYNGGAKTAYFVQGDVTAVATTSAIPVASGAYVTLNVNGTYIAAITGGSDTTTLTLYQSNGLISFGNGSGSGGGGGGSTTANQGTAAAVSAGWPVINGEPADTTGTFTNGTRSTAITTPSVDGYETATITLNGTYGTATGTFQASDDGGTTYYTLRCARTDSVAVEAGYTSLTNTNRAWFCPIHSFDTIRVQSSAVASGTVNVRISISASPTSSGVTASISGDSTIGVEGADGQTQASPSNPFPVSTVGSTFAPSQISLSTSAAQVLAAITNPAAREVCNIDVTIIEYVGATGVTSTTGIPINPGQCWDASHSSAAIFAVAASATPKVAVVQY